MLNNFNELSTWIVGTGVCVYVRAQMLKPDDNNDFAADNDYNDGYCEIEAKTRPSVDESWKSDKQDQKQQNQGEKTTEREREIEQKKRQEKVVRQWA